MKCKGTNAKGKPCGNEALPGSDYCVHHQAQAQAPASSERSPKSASKPRTRAQHRFLGTWLIGSLLLVFFVAVFWLAPDALPDFKQRMMAIVAALLAGLFGYFLTGDMGIEIQAIKTRFGEVGVKATGGLAMFAIVLVWWLSPLAPVGPGKENSEQVAEPGAASVGTGIATTGRQTIKGPVIITGGGSAPPGEPSKEPGSASAGVGIANTGDQVIEGPVTIGGTLGGDKQ